MRRKRRKNMRLQCRDSEASKDTGIRDLPIIFYLYAEEFFLLPPSPKSFTELDLLSTSRSSRNAKFTIVLVHDCYFQEINHFSITMSRSCKNIRLRFSPSNVMDICDLFMMPCTLFHSITFRNNVHIWEYRY